MNTMYSATRPRGKTLKKLAKTIATLNLPPLFSLHISFKPGVDHIFGKVFDQAFDRVFDHFFQIFDQVCLPDFRLGF